jgi:RHS repeat-associated protein
LEDRYEYDAFGKPYKGDLTMGMNLGYTGKPYDTATGLYNYGFRDYQPEVARFTTIDPIRDGNNWFAYVNNDPVNWVDPWGLECSVSDKNRPPEVYSPTLPNPSLSAIDNGRVFPTDATRITSTFGPEHNTGIDIGAETPGVRGDPVVSPVTGEVISAGINPDSPSQSSYVTIAGNNGTYERLLHTDNITVKPGDKVYAGEHIAEMSDVGTPGNVHTHYEVYKNKEDYDNRKATDPLSLYPGTNFTYDDK